MLNFEEHPYQQETVKDTPAWAPPETRAGMLCVPLHTCIMYIGGILSWNVTCG